MSIYEHNSNVLPWREAGAQIELIPLDPLGSLDFVAFEAILKKYSNYNSLKVATISAGSNVTGILVDVDRAAVICHKYGTLACFDYAAVAPYVPINMGGLSEFPKGTFPSLPEQDRGLTYKDAIFFSPHKFVGGPGSSGVLIAKKKVLYSRKPARVGGGIVFFVDELDHEYVQNVEELEESGTPGVIQDIRTGLVMQLKEAISTNTILEREKLIHDRVMSRLKPLLNSKLFLLGNNNDLPKVGIYSFLIRARVNGGWKFLNPPFVVSLLNDLFGLQTRSGCLCAGMYG
jgi:selenocysteine lyase/cysteine desulfurase